MSSFYCPVSKNLLIMSLRRQSNAKKYKFPSVRHDPSASMLASVLVPSLCFRELSRPRPCASCLQARGPLPRQGNQRRGCRLGAESRPSREPGAPGSSTGPPSKGPPPPCSLLVDRGGVHTHASPRSGDICGVCPELLLCRVLGWAPSLSGALTLLRESAVTMPALGGGA